MFGLLGGHLAEPQTAEKSKELNTYAQEILNNQIYSWIGNNDLGHGKETFDSKLRVPLLDLI